MKTNLKAMVERILETCETERKVSASVIRLMRDMRAELRAALRSYLAPVCLPARETLTPEKRRQVDLTKVRYLELCKRSNAVSMLASAWCRAAGRRSHPGFRLQCEEIFSFGKGYSTPERRSTGRVQQVQVK